MSELHATATSTAIPDPALPRHGLRSTLRQWRTRVTMPLRAPSAPAVKRNLSATLREWHKRAGLLAFLFMGWLGASGFLLNQSVSWGLDAVRIGWPWLMTMYGLHAEAPQTGFRDGALWLAQTSEHTVLGGAPLEQTLPQPIGLVAAGPPDAPLAFVATTDNSLLLLRPDGTRIDELRGYTLPVTNLRRIGRVEDAGNAGAAVAIQDLDVFVSRDGADWAPLPRGAEVRWSQAERLTEAERERVLPYARPTIALEQILIDAHSGRLFGRYGPWVINTIGFACVWLSISGAWMVWRTSRRKQVARR